MWECWFRHSFLSVRMENMLRTTVVVKYDWENLLLIVNPCRLPFQQQQHFNNTAFKTSTLLLHLKLRHCNYKHFFWCFFNYVFECGMLPFEELFFYFTIRFPFSPHTGSQLYLAVFNTWARSKCFRNINTGLRHGRYSHWRKNTSGKKDLKSRWNLVCNSNQRWKQERMENKLNSFVLGK
jgi:hypothetical protein